MQSQSSDLQRTASNQLGSLGAYLWPVLLLISLAALTVAGLAPSGVSSTPVGARNWGVEVDKAALATARATITEEEIEQHLAFLASPELEGRDSPSRGLERAAEYLAAELESYGFSDLAGDGSFRHGFTRALPAPSESRCSLTVDGGGRSEEEEQLAPRLGVDFVPLPGCSGEAAGQAIFVGFGIDRRGYDDLAKKKLKGKVAVILEGEPRHKRLFEGPDTLTDAADVYDKIQALVKEDVAGVLVVRRAPPKATQDRDGEALAPPAMGYRYTWATWNPATTERVARRRNSFKTPVLEITPDLASWILGEDILRLAGRIDESGKPKKGSRKTKEVDLSSGFENRSISIDNVAGLLEGSDPALRDEVLVLGAHYDHIGVDSWGRVGFGADDNGSGTSAMLEVAQALAGAPPRRSILMVFFSAEEDGLLGSDSFAKSPPIKRQDMVAMLNMDMVGRGDEDEVVVLGTRHNPDLEDILDDARKLKGHGLRKVITNRAEHLWERSDHFSFHRLGVPVLFFFEAVSETENKDYHTFRDTVDLVNKEKVANTARLCLHVAWLLANADERPASPR